MALAGVFSWICLVAQRQNMAVSDLSVVPMVLRMKNAMVSYCDYLGLALYPSGLNALYPYPFDTSTTYAVGCAVVLLVLLLGALLCARRAPYIPVGVYWFAGTLLPVIGFVQVGIQAKADRYAYLPYIGLYVAVVWAVGVLVTRRPKLKVGAALAFFVILALLVATTQRQVRTWKNGVALFERMLEVNPGNKTALFNLGGLLYTQERYAEAAKALEMYFQMDSWKPQALQMLTDALIELEEYDKAMGYMRYLMRLLPEDSDTTAKQAYIALMCGKLQFSIESLHAANKLEKNGKKARQRIATFVRLLLAKAFQADAKNKAAYYDAALALDPENTLALFTRAQFQLGHGELADAIVDLALARRFSPGFVSAEALLDQLLAPLNTPGNAIVLRQIAWRLATDPQPFRRYGAFAWNWRYAPLRCRAGKRLLLPMPWPRPWRKPVVLARRSGLRNEPPGWRGRQGRRNTPRK